MKHARAKFAQANKNWMALAWRIRWTMGKTTHKKARTMRRIRYWYRHADRWLVKIERMKHGRQ